MGIEINLNGLKKRIAGMEAAAESVAVDMVNELSVLGARIARENAPHDSGELMNSIHEGVGLSEKPEEGTIAGGYRTNSDHAVYLEYGTGQGGISGAVANGQEKDPETGITYREDWKGMPAQPYMYPSAKAVEEELPGILEKYGKQIVGGDGSA